MTRLSASHRSDYSLFRTLATRWGDVDIYGHVNNVVYLAYFDTAINGWYLEEGILQMGQSEKVFLVVETGAQYFAEIRFPDTVHAGIRVTRLGSTSVPMISLCLPMIPKSRVPEVNTLMCRSIIKHGGRQCLKGRRGIVSKNCW